MKRVKHLLTILALATGLACGSAGALDISDWLVNGEYDPGTAENRGQAGFTFLQYGGSARAEALGGAYGGAQNDPLVAFYNPAGLARLNSMAFGATTSRTNVDMGTYHAVAAARVGMVVVGVTFMSMDYGRIVGTRIADLSESQTGWVQTGDVGTEAWCAGLVAAFRITDRFNLALQAKYAVQDFDDSQVYSFFLAPTETGVGYLDRYADNRVATFAYDFGTQYDTGLRGVSLNMALLHYAGGKRFHDTRFELPLTYKVGISGDFMTFVFGEENETHKVRYFIDGVDRKDVDVDLAFGLEYCMDLSEAIPGLTFGLRGGRRAARYQEGDFSFGAGATADLGPVHLVADYTYSDYGPRLSMRQLSIALSRN